MDFVLDIVFLLTELFLLLLCLGFLTVIAFYVVDRTDPAFATSKLSRIGPLSLPVREARRVFPAVLFCHGSRGTAV